MAKRRSSTSLTEEERQAARTNRDRRNSKRKRRREAKKEGLKLAWWATTTVAAYLCLMAGRIAWNIRDEFPLEAAAKLIAVWFFVSAIFIAVPTLVVWVASKSKMASNITCVVVAGILFLGLFVPSLLTPGSAAQNFSGPPGLSQTDLLDLQVRAAAGEDVTDEVSKLASRFADSLERSGSSGATSEDKALLVLAAVMREFEPLITRQLASSHAYFSAGAASATGLDSRSAISNRLSLLKQLTSDTDLLIQFLRRLEGGVRSAMASEGIPPEEIDKFVEDFERGNRTQMLLDLRQKEYAVYQSHHNILSDLHNKFGNWRLVDNQIAFSQSYEAKYYGDFVSVVKKRSEAFHEAQQLLFVAQGKASVPISPTLAVTPVAKLQAPDNLMSRIASYRAEYLRALDDTNPYHSAMAQMMRQHKDLQSAYEQNKLIYEQAGAIDPTTLASPEIVQQRRALLLQLRESTWAYMKALEHQKDQLQDQFKSLGLDRHPAGSLASDWELSSLTRGTYAILKGEVNVLFVHESALRAFAKVGDSVTVQPDGSPIFSFDRNAQRYEKTLASIEQREGQLKQDIDGVVQYMLVHPEPTIPETPNP